MNTVLFLGFNNLEIKKWLQKPNNIVKVVVFDTSDQNREDFEKLYKQHMVDSDPENYTHLTMYEGCIERNVEHYLQKEANVKQDYIYSGDIKLLDSCKNNNQKEVHESCT